MSTVPRVRMSEAEYLAFEENQIERHEFVNGEIIAMSGVSDAHDLIQVNLTAALRAMLRGGPCRPRGAELRVRLTETGLYCYPDLAIVCGKPEFDSNRPPCLLNPRVVIEVLSESTEDWDRGGKAAHYRHRSSVETILLVDSRRRLVERQDRNPNGTWTLAEQGEGEVRVLDVSIPMDEVYDGVVFEGA